MEGAKVFWLLVFVIIAITFVIWIKNNADELFKTTQTLETESIIEKSSQEYYTPSNKKPIITRQPSIFQDPSKYRLKFPYPTDWKEIGGGYYSPGGEYEHDIPRPRKRSFSEPENDFEPGFGEYNGRGSIYTGEPCPEGVDIGESYPCEMYGIKGICTCKY